jgi:hypothetical protein
MCVVTGLVVLLAALVPATSIASPVQGIVPAFIGSDEFQGRLRLQDSNVRGLVSRAFGVGIILAEARYRDTTQTVDDVITAEYQGWLGRAPKPAELVVWRTILLDHFEGMLRGFAESAEFRTRNADPAGVIARFYQSGLRRTASAEEIAGWLAAMPFLGGLEPTLFALFRSAEYQAIARTPAEHAQVAYDTFFGTRTTTAAEIQAWRDYLIGGYAAFRRAVALSDEAAHLALSERIVNDLYVAILGRRPTGDESDGWVAYLFATGDTGGVVNAFFESQEYRAVTRTREEQVIALYRALLGRTPSAAEVAVWLPLVTSP